METPSTGKVGDEGGLIPEAVKRILSQGEEVEARYEMKGSEAYATGNRLIIVRDGQTQSHEYRKIAATHEISHSNAWLMLAGVALFALGGTSTAFPVAGAAMILLGVFTRTRRVELLVTGMKEPLVLHGTHEVLGPLVQRLTDRGVKKL